MWNLFQGEYLWTVGEPLETAGVTKVAGQFRETIPHHTIMATVGAGGRTDKVTALRRRYHLRMGAR